MVNCAVCGKEFKNRRGFKDHMKKHNRGEETSKEPSRTYLESLLEPISLPTPIQKLDLELSPEGHLKISIKKELLTKEELEL